MEELKKIQKTKLFDEVLKRLQELIFNLKGGDRLPAERKLAENLGVNRNIVREALKTLEALRMVEIKHGLGIFVQKSEDIINLESNIYKIYSLGNLNLKLLKDIIDARLLIEKHIIELACKNATLEDIEDLEEVVRNQESSAFKHTYKSLEEGEEFHLKLAHAGKNQFLAQLLSTIFIVTRTYRMEHVSTGEFDFLKDVEEHKKLLNTIKLKKIAAGQNIIVNHIKKWELDIEAIFEEKNK